MNIVALWGLEKIGRDKDKMKILWQVLIRKRKKSDMWSHKNTTHFIIDVATCLWIILKNGEKWYGMLELIRKNFYLTNCSPLLNKGGLLALKFRILLFYCLVTDWHFSKIPNSHVGPFIAPVVRVLVIKLFLSVTQLGIRFTGGWRKPLYYSIHRIFLKYI